jgi:hypothetical protein
MESGSVGFWLWAQLGSNQHGLFVQKARNPTHRL